MIECMMGDHAGRDRPFWSRKLPTAPKRQAIPADVALIVFGTDRRRKRRASRFSSSTARAAQSAAVSMGMRTIPVVTEAQRILARRLPRGTVSPEGHIAVKLVRPALFEKLIAVAGSDENTISPATEKTDVASAEAGPANANLKPSTNEDEWSKLMRGTRVLATDADSDGAWYVAIVQHVDQSNVVLVWQREDWKSLGKFSRNVTQLGLLHARLKKPY